MNADIKQIITVENFLDENPDLYTLSNEAIQSAIFKTASHLDGLCNGLITDVWNYNQIDPHVGGDPNNPLYRTAQELAWMREAFLAQTHYLLTIGQDFSQGSESVGIGSSTFSFQRPLDRDIYGPQVKYLLQKARLYLLTSISQDYVALEKPSTDDDYDTQYITFGEGDIRYVALNQPLATEGNIGVINRNHTVEWTNPSDINFKTRQAEQVLDWKYNDFKGIRDVSDLAFFGPDMYGKSSAMTRGDIINLVEQTFATWNPVINYVTGDIVFLVVNGENPEDLRHLEQYLALQPSTNKNPASEPTYWEKLAAADIPLDEIIAETTQNTIDNFQPQFDSLEAEIETEFELERQSLETRFTSLSVDLNTQIADEIASINTNLAEWKTDARETFIPNEVSNQLEHLRTTNLVIFAKGTRTLFRTLAEFNLTKTKYSITASQYVIEVETNKGLVQGDNGWNVGGKINDSTIAKFTNKMATSSGQVNAAVVSEDAPAVEVGTQALLYRKVSSIDGVISTGDSNPSSIAYVPRSLQSYIVTWLEDITQEIVIDGGESTIYEGVAPIRVDNTLHKISIDQSNFLTVDSTNSTHVNNNWKLKITDDTFLTLTNNFIGFSVGGVSTVFSSAGYTTISNPVSGTPQGNIGASLTRKDYVDSAIANIPAVTKNGGNQVLTGNGWGVLYNNNLGVSIDPNDKIVKLVAPADGSTSLVKATAAETYQYTHTRAYTQKGYVDGLVQTKQDKLTAGENITIANNIISATGGGGKTYTGIAPMIVDNTDDTIAFSPQVLSNFDDRVTTNANDITSLETGINTIEADIVTIDETLTTHAAELATIQNSVDTNTEAITSNTGKITNIETVIVPDLNGRVSTNTTAIGIINQTLSTHAAEIATNTEKVDDLAAKVTTLIGEFNVSWQSQTTDTPAGSNLKTVIGAELFNLLMTNNKYYITTTIFSKASDTAFAEELKLVKSPENVAYSIIGSSAAAWMTNATLAKNFTELNLLVRTAVGAAQGDVRFYAWYNSVLNPNFSANKIYIWKRP